MNILRIIRSGAKAKSSIATVALREKLPPVNAFVEISVLGSRRRTSVSISDINAAGIVTRHLDGLVAGATADFVYANETGRYRFATVCARVEPDAAFFDYPQAIKTIEDFSDRRQSMRVPWVIAVQWRYAPDGQGFGEFLDGSMMDLSRGGASLAVGRELKPGAQVEVRFSLKSKTEPFVELGRVVRAAKIETSDKNAAGIRFLELHPDHERILSEFVDERQALRHERGVI